MNIYFPTTTSDIGTNECIKLVTQLRSSRARRVLTSQCFVNSYLSRPITDFKCEGGGLRVHLREEISRSLNQK